MHLHHGVVLLDLQHQLRVDKAAEVEDELVLAEVQVFELLRERGLHIVFEDLAKVAHIELLGAAHAHLVEVLAIELAQITDQVLVDNFIADTSGLELTQLELNGVLVQDPLRGLLHSHGT